MLELNKLYNMDCMDGMKLIPNNSIDLIVTDPPYRITARGNPGSMGGMFLSKESLSGKIFKYNDVRICDYASEFYRLLKDGTHCYIMSNHINLQKMLSEFTQNGFKFVKCLIWNKGNKICCLYYMNQFEYILFFRKGKAKKINNCGTADILEFKNIKLKSSDRVNIHDTEKPVDLMKVLIENSSNKNDIVLDPFLGIGATAIAAKITKRNYIGFEIDTKYYTVANERLKEEKVQLQLDFIEHAAE